MYLLHDADTTHISLELDIVVSNAGGGGIGPARTASVDDFRAAVELNLVSNFVLTQAALPHLERTKGNICYISSVSGRVQNDIFSTFNLLR